jgi:hypothetical protein
MSNYKNKSHNISKIDLSTLNYKSQNFSELNCKSHNISRIDLSALNDKSQNNISELNNIFSNYNKKRLEESNRRLLDTQLSLYNLAINKKYNFI